MMFRWMESYDSTSETNIRTFPVILSRRGISQSFFCRLLPIFVFLPTVYYHVALFPFVVDYCMWSHWFSNINYCPCGPFIFTPATDLLLSHCYNRSLSSTQRGLGRLLPWALSGFGHPRPFSFVLLAKSSSDCGNVIGAWPSTCLL